jgi:D-sedoheptulose 7-phosphate isomerase
MDKKSVSKCMKEKIVGSIESHVWAVQSLLQNNVEEIEKLCKITIRCFKNGGKVLFAGNGGSAADCQHLAAEFVGRFKAERTPLPALALTTDTSILTSIANDYGYENVFQRQVNALSNKNDILILISTSGNSQNLINAVFEAKKKNLFTVALLGNAGGRLVDLVDLPIVVNANETARIQECHILIGHILCDACDESINSFG